MVVSVTILALYGWAYFSGMRESGSTFLVGDKAAIMAGVSFVIGLLFYIWIPKKYMFFTTLASFYVLSATSAVLILDTGGATSPFIALWMFVSVFAGVFGFYGLLPLFLAITSYVVLQITGGELSREALLTLVLGGELPLVVSYMIWHVKANPTEKDRAYRELATELSQVAGKAEVVINAIADGVVALDSQGVIQLINPAAQRIIGWGKQDALALDYKSVLKLVDKDNTELAPSVDPVVQALGSNQQATSGNLTLLTNSGKKLLISIVVSPVGQPGSGVIVVFRDVTKEKAEEREQAEFISTASHEMRTPVASIEGYLGLALNPATAQIDDKARDFITKAHLSAEHLGRLFQDLLDVTKADDSRLSNNPKVVDVVAFIHDIVQGLTPKAHEKGLRVLFKPQPDDDEDKGGERRINPAYFVNVDNDHLREVVANLVENAIKYTPQGDVVIDVNGDNDHVVISVADSGIGIPKEDQAHLFQKFYRVDNSATREIGGTGLGLYLCRKLTEAMSGRIWVDSEFQKGSTFSVELPRTSHEDATRLIEEASVQEEQTITAQTLSPLPEQPPVVENTPLPASQPASSELAYSSPSPEAIAQQLQNSIRTPAPAPTPPPQPQPVAPTPYRRPALLSDQPVLPNTPLTSIEQNPNQYVRTRPGGGVAIPPRDQK
ncbi:MAG TPA: ATP-binding protein [Candidatus Saccharimonadales bacterium]|nr:ATP-binding protein [Candidatus Saccharimonadales bacterium]